MTDLEAAMAAGAKPVAAPPPAPTQTAPTGESDYDRALKAGAQPADPGAAPTPKHVSGVEALARGALQGASLGFGDEISGAVESLFTPKTYVQARDEARANNKAAAAEHPYLYGGGELAGGAATAVVPGLNIAKGATALKVGLQGAALGGAGALGSSDASNIEDIAKDTAKGAALGGFGGALLHAAASKVGEQLAKMPGRVVEQDTQGLIMGGDHAGPAWSKARAAIVDENTPKVIYDPVQLENGKTTTLANIGRGPAKDVRAVLATQRGNYEQQLEPLLQTSDAKTGGVSIGDLVKHYDKRIGEYGANPMTEPFTRELENAKSSVLKSWGPTQEAVAAKQDEIGQELGKVYEKADAKNGGVRLGDLVKHYDDRIAELKKQPGNQQFVKALEDARDDVAQSLGTAPKFDPEAVVHGGSFEGAPAGKALETLEKIKAAAPDQAKDIDAEIRRIKEAATSAKFDPDVRVPAKQIRAYATTLQDRGAAGIDNPSVGAQARKMLGSTTRDFVNDHVGQTLGPADRKGLEKLNERMSRLYNVDDAMAGKTDQATRDAILDEFGKRVPAKEVSKFADTLEERGSDQIDRLNPGMTTQAKRELGNTTRDFLNKHLEGSVAPEQAGKASDIHSRLASLRKIDNALADRESKEAANKLSGGGHMNKLFGHAGLGGAAILAAHGNIPAAAASLVAPKIIEGLPAAGRFATRKLAGANELLARMVSAAANGNPWARRQLDLLRQSPRGLARLATAIQGGAGGGQSEAP